MKRKLNLSEPSEFQIQSAYFSILALNENEFPFLKYIFAIPNGGKRNIGVAVKMKREGVKRGVPDIFIPFANNGYHGLWIETKTSTGQLSKEQKEYKSFLENQGYLHKVCRSTFEMIYETEVYFCIELKNK